MNHSASLDCLDKSRPAFFFRPDMCESQIRSFLSALTSGWLQIAHRACEVFMAHPRLHCAEIDTRLKMHRGVCRTEFMQKPVLAGGRGRTYVLAVVAVPTVQLCPKSDSITRLKKVVADLTIGTGEHQATSRVSSLFMPLKSCC